ncbi:MAG TPA: hypothetical protein DEO38_04725 [Bacteroidales bacterium]|nr:hypothetical protein [Bacteroidales bacterium]
MERITDNNLIVNIAHGESRDLLLLQDAGSRISPDVVLTIHQAGGSHLRLYVLTMPGCDVNNNIRIEQQGDGCHSELYILGIGTGSQHFGNTTHIEHQGIGGTSREVAKYVLSDSSHGTFYGMLKVLAGAQKTEACQTNRNVLLTTDAAVNTKPELEIYADDVKCSHGATTGQLDEAALFYMRQRGIDTQTARRMLLDAFMADIIDKIPDTSLTEQIREQIAETL